MSVEEGSPEDFIARNLGYIYIIL